MGIRLFFIGLMVTALAGGGFYVLKLQKDNAILKANAIKLESAISEQKTLIENQKKDFEAILNANKEMNELIGKLKTDFAELDKRFNKKNSRLYLDLNVKELTNDDFLILDCFRVVDPQSETNVYNDHWLKQYTTSLIKRQWGQNLIKFTGVKLPGGLELNGRQLYDDAVMELEKLDQKLMEEYAMPPLDFVG